MIVRAPGPARSAKRHLPYYERASVESGGRAVVVGAEGSNVDFYVDLVSVTVSQIKLRHIIFFFSHAVLRPLLCRSL